MSQPHARRARFDSELLILVPILSLLLIGAGARMWHQLSAESPVGGSDALAVLHQVLRLVFYVMMIALLLVRKASRSSAPTRRATMAAYAGTFAPFLLLLGGDPGRASDALTAVAIFVTTVGLVLSVYALGWLGRSFGVVPQARELVRSGPYRYVRHPLYVAEFISFTGAVLTIITPFSALVTILFVTLQAYRATQEEKVLKVVFPEYEAYMSQAGRFAPRLQALSRAS